jgi:hypothetical protein
MRPTKAVKMVLDRKAVLRHPTGHSFLFMPGVPVSIPPACVKAVLGMGGRAAEDKELDLSEDEEDTRPYYGPADPEERIEEIEKIVATMIETNARDDWTGTGTPNINVVSARVGYKVTKNEVLEAFNRARLTDEPEVVTGE